MWQRLLEGDKLGLFEKNPELVEKYMIASEFSLEVMDRFFSRLFNGVEGPTEECVSGKRPLPEICVNGGSECGSAGLACQVNEHGAAIENLKRQVSALQLQLQMQGDVVKIASALERRLDDVSKECDVRLREGDEAMRSNAERVERAVEGMREELYGRANELSEEVSRLKGEIERDAQDGVIGRLQRDVADEGKRESIASLVTQVADVMDLGRDCMYTGSVLNGIIAHLRRRYGDLSGIVEATSSTVRSGYEPKNSLDLLSGSDFRTEDKPRSWLCYEFKGMRVCPTSYTIRSCDFRPGGCHPKSWIVEVSNDGSEGSWVRVDSRDNNEDLNGKDVSCNFPVSTPQSGGFHFIRLLQTGPNHYGNNHLDICALEIFGTILRD